MLQVEQLQIGSIQNRCDFYVNNGHKVCVMTHEQKKAIGSVYKVKSRFLLLFYLSDKKYATINNP